MELASIYIITYSHMTAVTFIIRIFWLVIKKETRQTIPPTTSSSFFSGAILVVPLKITAAKIIIEIKLRISLSFITRPVFSP